MEIRTPIWNLVDLPAPPVCTVKSRWCKEIRMLNGMLKEMTATLDSFNIILYETKLLSAILKRLEGELRMDKIYQLASKIIQCVKKCDALNLKEVVFKVEKTSSQRDSFDYQPSRQMLEYTLIRILGFTKLLTFLVDLCHKCAIHLKGKMQIGHFPAIVLTLFALVSRIWSVSTYFLENSFEWYLVLLAVVQFLEPTQIDWLPRGFEFPALPIELEQMHGIDQNKILTSLRSFLSDFEESATPSSNLQFLTKVHDLGETISREDFVAKGQVESRLPSQKDKTQLKKSVSNLNDTTLPSKKRKLADDGNSEAAKEVEQLAKRVFKTKYTRTLTVQKPVAGKRQVDTVSSNVVQRAVNNVSDTDIMQEIASLKQDWVIFNEESKVGFSINPKLKQKVKVVQEKTLSKNKRHRVSQSKLINSANNVDGTCNETNSNRSEVEQAVVSRGRTVHPVESDSRQEMSKKNRLQKLLEKKKKKMVASKKLKSKSWVIS